MATQLGTQIVRGGPYFGQPCGYQQLSPVAATGLTIPTTAAPTYALISVSTATAYWRDDGTAPTAGAGMPLPSGLAPFAYYGDLTKIQFISATGVVNVSYYR